MEFVDIGGHCGVPSCHQHDFLPFTCSHCSLLTCQDHQIPSLHSCPNEPQATTIACELCARRLPILASQSPEAILATHIKLGCPSRVSVKPHRCALKRCKKKSHLGNTCKGYGMEYCLAHRFPSDHKCAKKPLADTTKPVRTIGPFRVMSVAQERALSCLEAAMKNPVVQEDDAKDIQVTN